jgi:hypothetical protein
LYQKDISSELIICPNTGVALVSRKMFQYFKTHNNFFPEKWQPYALGSEPNESEPNESEPNESEPNESEPNESNHLEI